MTPPLRRSRSSSSDCASCASRKLAWQGHLCFRHAPCVTSDFCWDPARCDICLTLFAAAYSSSAAVAPRDAARGILREMIYRVKAVALNHDHRTFVRGEVFHRYFRAWMKSAFSESVIRSSPARRPSAYSSSSRPAVVPAEARSSSEAPSPRRSRRSGPEPAAAHGSSAPGVGVHRFHLPVARSSPVPETPPARTRPRSQVRDGGASPSLSGLLCSPHRSQARSGVRSRPRPRHDLSRTRDTSPRSRLSFSRSPSAVSVGSDPAQPGRVRRYSRSPSADLLSIQSEATPLQARNRPAPPLAIDEDPLMVRGRLYFAVPLGASSSASGFTCSGLPLVPVGMYSFARSASGRQVVHFTDTSSAPAFEYALKLKRATADSQEEPSQRQRNQTFANVLAAAPGSVSWSLSDVWSPAPSFVVPPTALLTQWASRMRQAKGYGDESTILPSRPLVPLRFDCDETQRLADFFHAPPLSPTSHQLQTDEGSRYTFEPDRVSKVLDSEYRCAAASSLSVLSAWELLSTMAAKEFPSPLARRFDVVLRTFERDVRALSEYTMLRAVHHRRNMIDRSTAPMPQDDVRHAVRDLPLSDGPTLVHPSAAQVVADQLRLPGSRRLAVIPHLRRHQPAASPQPGPSSAPLVKTTYLRAPAPLRQQSRPNPPSPPTRRSSYAGSQDLDSDSSVP